MPVVGTSRTSSVHFDAATRGLGQRATDRSTAAAKRPAPLLRSLMNKLYFIHKSSGFGFGYRYDRKGAYN